jgi:hypothetical protein
LVAVVTLYVCARLNLPFGPGLLAATIGLGEIAAMTSLLAWGVRKWGMVGALGGRRLEASLLATFTVAMLGFGIVTALTP